MRISVKSGRVWMPKNRDYRNKFLEIFIKNKNRKASFIAVIPEDGRFYVPIKIREILGVKDSVTIQKIKTINNKDRPSSLIKNGKIDVLGSIPKKTLSGYEIVVITKNDKYCCWYCTKGRPNEMLLNKKVPLSFVRFLGYYQAEGGKPKLNKRRGRTFSFTNTKLNLIKDFFELSQYLIDKDLWNVSVKYNPNIDKMALNKLKEELKCIGLGLNATTAVPVGRLKSYSITLWISNSVLAETIDNMNKKMKRLILLKRNSSLFENYFRGVIAGDGTFFAYRDKNGSLHSRMAIYDGKERYIVGYKKILDSYGLKGNIRKLENKNMYVLTLNNNWDMLLHLLKFDLFSYTPKHKNRLVWTIKSHNRYRSLKYLINLKKTFDICDVNMLTKRGYSYSANWIKKREQKQIVKFVKIKDGRQVWKLTTGGEDLKNTLKLIEGDSN